MILLHTMIAPFPFLPLSFLLPFLSLSKIPPHLLQFPKNRLISLPQLPILPLPLLIQLSIRFLMFFEHLLKIFYVCFENFVYLVGLGFFCLGELELGFLGVQLEAVFVEERGFLFEGFLEGFDALEVFGAIETFPPSLPACFAALPITFPLHRPQNLLNPPLNLPLDLLPHPRPQSLQFPLSFIPNPSPNPIPLNNQPNLIHKLTRLLHHIFEDGRIKFLYRLVFLFQIGQLHYCEFVLLAERGVFGLQGLHCFGLSVILLFNQLRDGIMVMDINTNIIYSHSEFSRNIPCDNTQISPKSPIFLPVFSNSAYKKINTCPRCPDHSPLNFTMSPLSRVRFVCLPNSSMSSVSGSLNWVGCIFRRSFWQLCLGLSFQLVVVVVVLVVVVLVYLPRTTPYNSQSSVSSYLPYRYLNLNELSIYTSYPQFPTTDFQVLSILTLGLYQYLGSLQYQYPIPTTATTAKILNFPFDISSIKSFSLKIKYSLADAPLPIQEGTYTSRLQSGHTQVVWLREYPISKRIRESFRLMKKRITQRRMKGRAWVDLGRGSRVQVGQVGRAWFGRGQDMGWLLINVIIV